MKLSIEEARKLTGICGKVEKLAPKVVASLEEAGEELLTFTVFPTANGNRCARPMLLSGSTGNFAEE